MIVRLIQVRTEAFLREHEIECVLRSSGLHLEECQPFDALARPLTLDVLDGADAVIIGGSGEYSATGQSPLHDALEAVIRECYERRLPLLGLCFGHHMMARALGGKVVTDKHRSETGTVRIDMLPTAGHDPLVGHLPAMFFAAQGHNDSVIELPTTLENLATSERSPCQLLFAPGRPFYGLQFHPELRLEDLKQRLAHYGYLDSEERRESLGDLRDSPPEVQDILRRFVEIFVNPSTRKKSGQQAS